MRSTMTWYPDGSPIRVPVSVTYSAVTPCLRPSVSTRSRNAGGKEYSRPYSSPTLTVMTVCSYLVGARRLLDALPRFLDDRLHDRAQVAGVPVHVHLALRARAVGQDLLHVLHLAPAPQIVHDIVDELDELEREIAHRHLAPLAEIDQLAIDPPARGAPLVLLDQRAMIAAEAEVALAEAKQLHDDRLRERGDRDRRARRGRHVAGSELERAAGRGRAQGPPDLLAVVDAVEPDQRPDVLLVFAP